METNWKKLTGSIGTSGSQRFSKFKSSKGAFELWKSQKDE